MLTQRSGAPSRPSLPSKRRALRVMLEGDAGAPRRLEETLELSGHEALATISLEAAPEHEPLLVVYDGRLGPEHAKLLERKTPALLLASTPGQDRPGVAELATLRALLSQRSLIEGVPWQVTERVHTLPRLRELAKEVSRLSGEDVPHAADVAYELLANAMLDAPMDATGAHRYAYRRTEVTEVAPEDACELRASVVGSALHLIVRDRFGGLTVGPVARTVSSLGSKARVNASGGGAGLGMRRILEQTDCLAFRVVSGRLTEVFCTVELGGARRRGQPKSLFFLKE